MDLDRRAPRVRCCSRDPHAQGSGPFDPVLRPGRGCPAAARPSRIRCPRGARDRDDAGRVARLDSPRSAPLRSGALHRRRARPPAATSPCPRPRTTARRGRGADPGPTARWSSVGPARSTHSRGPRRRGVIESGFAIPCGLAVHAHDAGRRRVAHALPHRSNVLLELTRLRRRSRQLPGSVGGGSTTPEWLRCCDDHQNPPTFSWPRKGRRSRTR
jgi:hypothetical protein